MSSANHTAHPRPTKRRHRVSIFPQIDIYSYQMSPFLSAANHTAHPRPTRRRRSVSLVPEIDIYSFQVSPFLSAANNRAHPRKEAYKENAFYASVYICLLHRMPSPCRPLFSRECLLLAGLL